MPAAAPRTTLGPVAAVAPTGRLGPTTGRDRRATRPAPRRRPSTIGPRGRMRWVDVAALALLALVVRLPAYVADTGLTFDDGVFANSAIAMRDGGVAVPRRVLEPGPALPAAGRTGRPGRACGRSTRLGCSQWSRAWWRSSPPTGPPLRLTDRVGALLAGGLLAVSGGLAWVTGPLAADGPALAFAALTMGLTLRQRDAPTRLAGGAARRRARRGAVDQVARGADPRAGRAGPAGPGGVRGTPASPATRPALLHGVIAAASALAVFLAVTVPLGVAEVWDQSVVYRTDAAADRDIPATAAKLVSTLWDRDLATLFLVGAVALVCGVIARRRTGSARVAVVDDDVSWASASRWSADGSLGLVAVGTAAGRVLAGGDPGRGWWWWSARCGGPTSPRCRSRWCW